MNSTMTASEAYAEVVSEVEKIANDEHAFVSMESPGDTTRQGDLYIVRLDKPIPGGKPAGTWQLAPGSTQGSRHVAEGDCDIFTVDHDRAEKMLNRLVPATRGHEQFIGPMIKAKGDVLIAHPEHGDRTLTGGGEYLVTYQKTWAGEVRRTQD